LKLASDLAGEMSSGAWLDDLSFRKDDTDMVKTAIFIYGLTIEESGAAIMSYGSIAPHRAK